MAYPKADVLDATHTVDNVASPLEDYNSFDLDLALSEAVAREGARWATAELTAWGAACGSRERIEWGFMANAHRPVLQTHDRYGRRIDQVDYHPAYHWLMQASIEAGLHSAPFTEARAGAHVARAAGTYMQAQVEAGHGCPITMTFACTPTLLRQPSLADSFLPKVHARAYDPRNVPYFEKRGLTLGMAMTEKQGGSDVRSNSTYAYPIDQKGPGQAYELVGHKFFVSAPMCDAFVVLAQTAAGMGCFLLPRYRPDGSKNPLHILRLKNKMGNVSNASSETELRGAFAWLIGEEGRGIANILDMVALTRFDCMLASAAGMRQAALQALHHCRLRRAFGARLSEQPLMANVLADLCLEAEASLALAMRVARALDAADHSEAERSLLRLATPIGKYWICKRAPGHAYEAMECIGGSGVMENHIMPRLYREAPINPIWEGSGNIQCLDMLRAIQRDPGCLTAYLDELAAARGGDPRLDRFVEHVKTWLNDALADPFCARRAAGALARALQGALLVQHAPPAIADAFCASRLSDGEGHVYGTLPARTDPAAILQRAYPS